MRYLLWGERIRILQQFAEESEGFDVAMTVEVFNSYVDSDNYTSMLQDYFHKRKNEIDFINGVIIEFGEKNGVDVSVNKTIYDIVKSIENINLEGKVDVR